MKAGDPVLLSGTYQMGGIGLEDEDCLVETHGQYVKVRRSSLIDAKPQPIPPTMAMIGREELVYVLRRLTADDPHRPAIEAALGMGHGATPWLPGARRFFCVTERSDAMVTAIVLAPDKERAAAIAAQELNFTDPHEPVGFVVVEMAGPAHDVKVERAVSYEGVTLGEHDPD